jgi:hypothetical protein
MKTAFLMLFSLPLSLASANEIVAKCGKYDVIYSGERNAYFAGVKVTQSEFLIQTPSGSKIATTLQLNSEGGRLQGSEVTGYDASTGSATSTLQFVYENIGSEQVLKISRNGEYAGKAKCFKP